MRGNLSEEIEEASHLNPKTSSPYPAYPRH